MSPVNPSKLKSFQVVYCGALTLMFSFSTSECMLAKNLTESLSELDSIVQRDPQNIQGLRGLGDLYHEIGITSEAERFYRRALDIAPFDGGVNLAIGRILLQKGEYGVAKSHLQKSLSADSTNTECLNTLAEIALVVDNDKAGAKKYYERTLSIDKRNEYALLNSAVLLVEQGDTSAALIRLKDYVALFPDSIQGHLNLGFLLDLKGQFHEAFVQFSRVLVIDPKNVQALQSLGVLFFKRNIYMESNRIFEKIYNIRSSLPITVGLALGYHFEENTDKALAVLEKAIVTSGENAYMLRLLMADIALVAGKHERTIEYCKLAHLIQGKEHIEQEIINAVYQGKSVDSPVLLHKDGPSADAPFYSPGSIIKLFKRELDN